MERREEQTLKQFRRETDSFGAIDVPAARLWGAQTQRALKHFAISGERMPAELIRALAVVKRACALANRKLGLLPEEKAAVVMVAAGEVIDGQHCDEFPLSVWQTGSGTQTLGHADPHEHQRSAGQPRLATARRRSRCRPPRAPQ